MKDGLHFSLLRGWQSNVLSKVFLKLCVCAYLVHMRAGACEVQNKVLHPLE